MMLQHQGQLKLANAANSAHHRKASIMHCWPLWPHQKDVSVLSNNGCQCVGGWWWVGGLRVSACACVCLRACCYTHMCVAQCDKLHCLHTERAITPAQPAHPAAAAALAPLLKRHASMLSPRSATLQPDAGKKLRSHASGVTNSDVGSALPSAGPSSGHSNGPSLPLVDSTPRNLHHALVRSTQV